MSIVTISTKFQVVIPQEVREKLGLKPGQKIIVVEKDGVVHMIPEKPLKELRGFVKGVTTENLREEEDRFWFIDSCVWIEYFGEGPNADKYAAIIKKAKREEMVTLTIVIYEVYKKIKCSRGEEKALEGLCSDVSN